jgi:hypothetical protein
MDKNSFFLYAAQMITILDESLFDARQSFLLYVRQTQIHKTVGAFHV